MSEMIPLFPLKSVLFPRGRLQLQIFEQRYLDMIRKSLREDSGFGICLLQEGEEVVMAGRKQTVHRIGMLAKIVDWDSLPNGLLGITIEGIRKFTVQECWSQDDQLLMAQVEFSSTDHCDEEPIPVEEDSDTLEPLLRQLMDHPMIQQLDLAVDFNNLREIGWRLAELLPVSAKQKQALLEIDDALLRAREIEVLVAGMIKGNS